MPGNTKTKNNRAYGVTGHSTIYTTAPHYAIEFTMKKGRNAIKRKGKELGIPKTAF